jgi:DNA-binding SARP family transcriptional activator
MPVRFRVLGPLRVWDGAAWVPVRAGQQRIVLAVLLVEAGRLVATDRLIDEIWGEHPPRAAASVLRGYVLRLRKLLGGGTGGVLVTRAAGYELAVDEEDLDARLFDRLATAGRQALAAGALDAAVSQLSQALALWRGAALAEVPATPTVTSHASALEQTRLAVTEDLLGAQLDLGRHDEVVGDLHRLVAEHPLRERLWEQLMLALYRCGRRGDALEAYQRARDALVGELGLEPGRQLQQLQRAILSDDPDLAIAPALDRPSPARVIVPAQLPPGITSFAGRDGQLKQLDTLPYAAADASAPAVVCITGTAGVGKTTLAVHWAHQVADQFPDGQLYANLRGFDPTGSVMSPAEAIRGFLDAFQVTPERIPARLAAQVGLYRSLLSGRRVLIVLDNARDAEQVRPLLPGSPGCLVLVTSRNQLTGLVAAEGAHPVSLPMLVAGEARQLLERRLGAVRVAAEPAAIDEIIDRCAGLPLALAIVAARAATHCEFGLAVLAREFGDTDGGLDAFAGEDASTDVRAVFSWSYRALRAPAARLFRLLALHAGPDLSAAAAASLAGVAVVEVRSLLAELARAHLVTEHAPGRYAFHDLLRAYATELVETASTADERRPARHRMLDHYVHTADAAAAFDPYRTSMPVPAPQPGTTPERHTDSEQALGWFATEHQVLLAAVAEAARTGYDNHTYQLASAMVMFLQRRGHWRDWVDTQLAALAAARRLADPALQARAHRNLTRAYGRLERYEDAHAHLKHALELLDELGDTFSQAHTQIVFGQLLDRQGRHREALEHTQHSAELFRATGDRAWYARALNAVGWCHARLGDFPQAIASCREALGLLEVTGDRPYQAATWHSLGYCYHRLGRHQEAVECYRQSVDGYQELGDRFHEAGTLTHLGDAYQAVGELGAAQAAWRRSLTILDGLGHPDADGVRKRLGT